MKKTKDFSLRQVGKQYMIVDTSRKNVDLSCVYTMNATAAYLWEEIGQKEFNEDMLVSCLCERYDIDESTAMKDIGILLATWKKLRLIEN